MKKVDFTLTDAKEFKEIIDKSNGALLPATLSSWILQRFSEEELADGTDADWLRKVILCADVPEFQYNSNMDHVMRLAYNIALNRAAEVASDSYTKLLIQKLKIK